jgi:hypothetical protein
MLPKADVKIRTRLANEVSADANKLTVETSRKPSEIKIKIQNSPTSMRNLPVQNIDFIIKTNVLHNDVS